MGRAVNGSIDSQTVLFGVFGDPIGHSKSPIMLNRAFREAGINAAYAAFHVKPGQLKEAVQGIRALHFRGVNVTIPHKVEVMSYLDEIDQGAEVIGAVNTIVNEDGKLKGYNTDGIGYVRSLREDTGIAIERKNVLILGAGGAARGIVYALAQENPNSIRIANRTKQKADDLALNMEKIADISGMGLHEIGDINTKVDLVVNTTSVGMHPHIEDVPMETAWLNEHTVVSDLIYNPRTTKLLSIAKAKGCSIHGGLGMFVYQGAYAFEYWTGRAAPVKAMKQAVEMEG